ncbi:pullulanase-associated domain-containing protein [Cohnella faecalis]|uniref:Pullulanase carbohydrate-binding module 41 domain-containing protein n=1 Tax=Cohnella faecalis TaxID=2315694 RepID=A0A398CPR1_9BACL|nr:pullulanase-associated domain-containing protein [Cohnella faecalis]RIE04412.1 hypothetical protein D3H35_07450 [Cohnella faecalis]
MKKTVMANALTARLKRGDMSGMKERNGMSKIKSGFRIGVMLWVLCCFIGVLPVSAKTTETGTTKVTVHYKQKEGDPIDWSLWVWGDSENGVRLPFTGTDEFGKVAEIELPGKFHKVGIIVSTDDWKKDGGDRFVEIVNGSGEISITGEGYIEDTSGRDVPYLWLIVGVVVIPVLLHIFEYIRSRKGREAKTA